MRFDDLLFHYTNGLSDRLKYEVMSKSPKSMDETLAIATQCEHLHARNPVDVDTMSYKHNRHNQGSSTGSRRFIPTVTPRTDKPNCSYCHKRGHTFNDCYSRQNAPKSLLLFPILIHGHPLRLIIQSRPNLNHAVRLVPRFVKAHVA
jgi:hypothetical protein